MEAFLSVTFLRARAPLDFFFTVACDCEKKSSGAARVEFSMNELRAEPSAVTHLSIDNRYLS